MAPVCKGPDETDRPDVSNGPDEAARRRSAAIAGHTGDEQAARSLVDDPAPAVRASALGALGRMSALTVDDLHRGLGDPEPLVRRRAVTEARHRADVGLVGLLDDPDDLVVEVVAWALGERSEAHDLEAGAVAGLAGISERHADPLVREAAVAALGAIGDVAGLAAILRATTDKPAIRRRAVLALAPFDGPEVDEALQRALTDRDWQVRQAAEDLLSPD